MNKIKKYQFNMVEIALAIAVIAIGISSLLVLFPIGINATRAAMEENCYHDAAETVAAFVRSSITNEWLKGENGNNLWDSSFNSEPSEYKDLTDYSEKKGNDLSGLIASSTKGCYKFIRLGPEGEEIFSAKVNIRFANDDSTSSPIYIPNVDDDSMKLAIYLAISGGTPGSLNEELKNFSKSVLVEISWPAEAAEADRTKRSFRIDVYNPYEKISPSS